MTYIFATKHLDEKVAALHLEADWSGNLETFKTMSKQNT